MILKQNFNTESSLDCGRSDLKLLASSFYVLCSCFWAVSMGIFIFSQEFCISLNMIGIMVVPVQNQTQACQAPDSQP